jgi:hypothetical protein
MEKPEKGSWEARPPRRVRGRHPQIDGARSGNLFTAGGDMQRPFCFAGMGE